MSNFSDKFKDTINNYILPAATKFGSNNIIQAVSTGLMYTLPLTLGASFFTILASFPIPAVATWFENAGLIPHFNAAIGGTLNIISIFLATTISFAYTRIINKENTNPLMAGLLGLATFVILMPQTVGEDSSISALSYDYLGSQGMFVAILLGILVSKVYVSLSQNKKLLIKMPEGVPPMVSQSFEPLIVSLIILTSVVVLRVGLDYTPIGNVFSLVQTIIAQPLQNIVGSSPIAFIGITLLGNSLFFFGVHPNAINSVLHPIIFQMAVENVEAFQAGLNIPHQDMMVLNAFLQNDAAGSTLSLLVAIFIFCRSNRYRSIAKITIIPNIFNINEPLIFGLPIMLNPIMFVPYVLSTLISGTIGYVASISGFITYYNPAMAIGLPWTTPKIISAFFSMGWQGVVLRIVVFIVMLFVYLPFIKALDKKALIEEKEGVSDNV